MFFPLTRGMSNEWRKSVMRLLVALFFLFILYKETYEEIVLIWWNNETFAHGFLIPLIIMYLLWKKLPEILVIEPKPSPSILSLILILSVIWLLGYLADLAVLMQFSAIALIPVIIWMMLGNRVASRIMFPLMYFFFAVPLGEFLVPLLQNYTATFTVKALQYSGIPVYWEGLFFYLPTGSFEVAKACSGVRYLIASLALGTLYAYLTYRSLYRRLLFILVSIIVPVVANGLRAYGIVMMAYYSDYKLAAGVDHILYGWLFFGFVMFLMFWIGSFFKEQGFPQMANKKADNDQRPHVPIPRKKAHRHSTRAEYWVVFALLAAATGPVLAVVVNEEADNIHDKILKLPTVNDGWDGPFSENGEAWSWSPHFPGSNDVRGLYDKYGKPVELYVAYFYKQKQGVELVNVMNSVFDPGRARLLSEKVNTIILRDGTGWDVREVNIKSLNGGYRLIWQWYEISGTATTNPIAAKALEIRRRLFFPELPSATILLSSVYELDADDARKNMQAFLNSSLSSLRTMVKQ